MAREQECPSSLSVYPKCAGSKRVALSWEQRAPAGSPNIVRARRRRTPPRFRTSDLAMADTRCPEKGGTALCAGSRYCHGRVQICMLAGPPWAICWGMALRGQFSYRFACWRDFPGPLAGKWLPEAAFSYRFVQWRGLPGPLAGKWLLPATFRLDLYAGATSLGHLLGNGLWGPLFV